jgi:glycosyltransferase involved in cell wall biosynthesis
MNTLSLISIITPSYNQGQYLEETIQSVITQNYPNIEYIIIDGASTDNSIEIIKKHEQFITYWVSEPDNGQAHAINKGLKKATGDIIAWINSDDIYFPNAFLKINEFFQNNPTADIVYGNGVWIDRESKIIKRRKNLPFHYKTWFYGMADPFQPEVFYRIKVLDVAGFVDKSFFMMMDREWWIRMANKGLNFKYIATELAALRKYNDTKSAKFAKQNRHERWRLHGMYWKGFKFKRLMLHKIYWQVLNYYYRTYRQIRLGFSSFQDKNN